MVCSVPLVSGLQLLHQHHPIAARCQARRTSCPARYNVVAAGAQQAPTRRQQDAATAEAATVSRAQLLKSSLLAASTMLLGAASTHYAAAEAAEIAEPAAAAAVAAAATVDSTTAQQTFSKVLLSTLADCQLAVSVYPTFSYNAAGGGGSGEVRQGDDGLLHVRFDPASLNIPPINAQHASILGIPVPPPLNIAIVPQRLEGTVDPATGRVDLDFLASFEFTAGPLYRAAPLTVATTLTTESSEGVLRSGTGQRLRADGRARLVGVARVPVTEDALVNTFLMLPTDALAVLSAELHFS